MYIYKIRKIYHGLQCFRLILPGKLIDSEKEFHKIKFDGDEGAFTVKCMKQTFGEHFQGLDMLTQLLKPNGADKVNKPLVEVLSGGKLTLHFKKKL